MARKKKSASGKSNGRKVGKKRGNSASARSGAKSAASSRAGKRGAASSKRGGSAAGSAANRRGAARVTEITARSTAARKMPVEKSSRTLRSSLGTRGNGSRLESVEDPKGLGARSGGQSGALQGLSDVENAESESVDELLEEGNAFEAEVVQGVENAPNADEGEVKVHDREEQDTGEEYREN
jgi:hypothetical protein